MMQDAFSRCHPILNFFYFLVVMGITMFMQHPVFLALSFVAAIFYAVWLEGWRKVLRMNLLFTLPGLLITSLLNPMFNHYGVTPLLYIESSGNWVTLEALIYGMVLGCVLFIIILWFSCYNQVMTSDKFIYLFGRIIPALSLMLAMALRFVPHFTNQMKVIRNGQKCVGMDVSNGSLLSRIRHGLNMISILVTWALENAIETADSMKSRGYGLHGRTAFSIYHFDQRDRRLGAAMLLLTALVLYGCSRGAAFAQYNPRILLAGFVVMGYTPEESCSLGLALLTFVSFGLFAFLPLLLDVAEEASMKRSRKYTGKDMETTYRQIYEELDRGGQMF